VPAFGADDGALWVRELPGGASPIAGVQTRGYAPAGRVAERTKATVLKTVDWFAELTTERASKSRVGSLQ
jgi:hypothetical protein